MRSAIYQDAIKATNRPRPLASRRRRHTWLPWRWFRVPVVLQMATADCAPACLAMILRWFGIHVPLSTCRQECSNARDGTTAHELIAAARARGLTARGLAGPADALPALPLPIIVHWGTNHFVVVEQFRRRTVRLVDPAVGRRTVTSEAFAASYSGVVLTFDQLRREVRQTHRRGSALRSLVTAALLPIRGKLAQILMASLLAQLLALSIPFATAFLLDDVIPRKASALMPTIGVALLVLVVAQLLADYLRGVVLVVVQRSVDSELMQRLFQHILALPLRFFEDRKTADLMERLGSTALVREVLCGRLVASVLDGAFLIVYLGLLWVADPVTAGATVVLGCLQVGVVLAINGRLRILLHEHLLAQAMAQSCLLESLQSIAIVKATGANQRVFRHWHSLFQTDLDLVQSRARINAGAEALQGAFRLSSTLLLLWLGAWRVLDGQLKVGEMMALMALAMLLLGPVNSLVLTMQQLQSIAAHLARIGDVLDAEPEPTQLMRVPPAELRGKLEMRGVSFRYHSGAPLVLRDVSFVVEPGQKFAVVGASGSGKSTLGMLLLGLYEPSEGQVLIDDRPVSSLDKAWLRDRFGVVLQHGGLFSESVRHNVSMADPDMPPTELVAAARAAQIHDDISALPLGYDTTLVEAGGGLSGGQRQRLAIARAIARRPRVLLLDEATSSLDTITEAKVERSLRELTCTRVVVAHRLSTVADADHVIVLDAGRIAESGQPRELLRSRGVYWALSCGSQRADFATVDSA